MTTETKFTAGPWVARPDESSSCEWEVIKTDARKTSISQDPWFICACMDSADGASAEANAHLIAAAPELYEALELVIGTLSFDREDDFNKEVLRRINAALSKARGEA